MSVRPSLTSNLTVFVRPSVRSSNKPSSVPAAGLAPEGDLPPAPTEVADAGAGILEKALLEGNEFFLKLRQRENVSFFIFTRSHAKGLLLTLDSFRIFEMGKSVQRDLLI